MKIVYDSQTFAAQEFGGISRYFCALAAQMSHFPDVQAKIVAPIHINGYLKDVDSDIALGLHVRRLPKTGRVIKALSSALYKPVATWLRPDVVHETYYAEQPSAPSHVPHVLTVYDMIHERFPDSFMDGDSVTRLKGRAVNRADHIFCISENTRRGLLDSHPIPEERVTVTYLGYDALPLSGLRAEVIVGVSPYIFHVAGRYGYKNFEGLMRAFAAAAWLKDNSRIVCFCDGTLSASEHRLFQQIGLPDEKVFHVVGGDDRLAALYKAAAAFVYPSKYEDFGIPPLEAMSLDCPVICSNTTSIPEVVGDAGEYFNPYGLSSIRTAIDRVLQSSALRVELISLGRTHCKQFTWERCAQETLDVYRRLAA